MTTTIDILNLKCKGCVNTVKKGLLSIKGVNEIDVDLENSKVIVPTDNKDILIEVKAKLSKMGYPELGDANTMLHKAKSFVSCASGRMTSETE
ncbi:MAG: heavy metal-associated domain-containing protein [Bacteroidota bacterium]